MRFVLFSIFSLFLIQAQAIDLTNYKLYIQTENYPPFNMSIEDKNFSKEDGIDGISTDIVRELMKRSGISYNMTLRFPWKRIYNMTLEKPNYALFSTTRTEAREKLFQWVGPLVNNDYVIFVMAGSSTKINSLEDLKGIKVGGYKGSAITEYLISKGVPIVTSHKDNANPKKLERGQIDAWVAGDITGRYIAELEGVTGLRTAYRVRSAEMYLAVNLDTPKEVVDQLQATLDQMRKEGVINQFTERYQ